MKYGDSVVLIQKQPDGSLLRTNAIVLNAGAQDGHLDLVYPTPLPAKQTTISSSNLDAVFRKAYSVSPYAEGSWIGWDTLKAPAHPAVAEQQKLKTFLLTNFKKETGDETPEACAIRLLSKKK